MNIPRVCALVFVLLALAPGVRGGERLSMSVRPIWSFAPADLQVNFVIAPSADNRSLEIVADSSEFYRSSLIQLDGDGAPRVISYRFRSLPSGSYGIRGVLTDAEGRERALVQRQVTVLATEGERP